MLKNQDANEHNDTYDKEAGQSYAAAGAGQAPTDADRRTVNYLLHRMLWEQQAKSAPDHWGPDGNLRVEDIDD